MAIKEIRREWSPCQLDYVKEFLLHSEADVKNLPACCVGSKARVSETGNVYTCSASGEWAVKDDGGVDECESAAHKMYVTDADGKPHWEDKLAYEESAEVEVMPPTKVGRIWYSFASVECQHNGAVKVGDTGVMYINGKPRKYTATEKDYSGGGPSVVVQLNVDGLYGLIGLTSSNALIFYNVSIDSPMAEHTVSLTVNSTITKTIDPKFLPAGAGVLTVEVVAVMPDGASEYEVTSHSHNAKEIYAAFKAGMQVQVYVKMNGGTELVIMPLMAIMGDGSTIMFACPVLALTVAETANSEVWSLQANI